jgi:hypothetical protein
MPHGKVDILTVERCEICQEMFVPKNEKLAFEHAFLLTPVGEFGTFMNME